MIKRIIDEYNQKEIYIGNNIANKILNKEYKLKDAKALYPEYPQLTRECGLHRPGVNIGSMLFLYPKIIAFVPPMRRKEFPKRFGISFDTFLILSDPSFDHRFIFPILNHPKYYNNLKVYSDLKPLIDRFPPTWERWHQALKAISNNYWFKLCDDLVDYENVLNQKDIRNNWKNKLFNKSIIFVNEEIRQQIRNRFTDLCLIGKENEAKEIASFSKTDPHLFITDLSIKSELFSYPKIYGVGGNLNFVTTNPRYYFNLVKNEVGNKRALYKIFDSDVIETLTKGLFFNNVPGQYHLDFLIEWHKQNKSNEIRNIYKYLLDSAYEEKLSISEINHKIKILNKELVEFCKNAYSDPKIVDEIYKKRKKDISLICTSGGIFTGLIGLYIPFPLLFFASGTIIGLIGGFYKPNRTKIEKAILKRDFPNFPYELIKNAQSIKDFRENAIMEILKNKDSKFFEYIKNVQNKNIKREYFSSNLWIPNNF